MRMAFRTSAALLSILFFVAVCGCGPTAMSSGKAAPELEVTGWTNGGPPMDLEGNVVVVEFFGTWCQPCIEHTPSLIATYERFEDRDVKFVSVTEETQADLPMIDAFAEQLEVPWPVGYGGAKLANDMEVSAFPTTFVIARDGTVVWNSFETGTLDGAIRKAL